MPPGGRTSIVFADEFTNASAINSPEKSFSPEKCIKSFDLSVSVSSKDLNSKYSKTFQSTVFSNSPSNKVVVDKAIRKMVDPHKGTIKTIFKVVDATNLENDVNPNVRHTKKPTTTDKTSIQTIFSEKESRSIIDTEGPRYYYNFYNYHYY
jgi:hypothetical protein